MSEQNKPKEISDKTNLLDRMADGLSHFMMIVCVFIFAVMVFSVAYGVLGRYISFIYNPRWTQELAILCMVWLCFLGSGYAIREGLHVRMELINYIVPKKVASALHFLSYVVLLIVNILWIVYGVQTAALTAHAVMPATGWPMPIQYLSLVVGGFYGAAMSLYRLLKGGF
jgi:TRAP-type C4-dicarboxylate transport system permease small subunit